MAGEQVHPVALEDIVHATGGDLNAVVPFQVPHDLRRTEMVGPTEMEDLVLDLGRSPPGPVLPTAGFSVDETLVALPGLDPLPLVEGLPGHTEIAASQ